MPYLVHIYHQYTPVMLVYIYIYSHTDWIRHGSWDVMVFETSINSSIPRENTKHPRSTKPMGFL